MKKILIRGGLFPYDNNSSFEVMLYDKIGTNSGNMLFLNGVIKYLDQDDVEIQIDHYSVEKSTDPEKTATEINERFDMFVIPLADAFRPSFVNSLNRLTNVIKKLTIPCVVTGVGLTTSYEPDFQQPFSFDNAVVAFMRAVAEKSTLVGVRGEITSKYLTKLGFGKEHTIIGCPSMYLCGNELTLHNSGPLSVHSRISFNSGRGIPSNTQDCINRAINRIEDCYFITQSIEDFRLIYVAGITKTKVSSQFPTSLSHRLFLDNRIRIFVNVKTWIEFLSQCEFSFGRAIHGTIAAVLAGTPALLIAIDSRTRELAEYHNINFVKEQDIDKDSNIFDLYESCNFAKVKQGYEQRFQHYLDFLKANQLPVTTNIDKETNAYENKMAKLELEKPVECFSGISKQELIYRIEAYHAHLDRRIKKFENNNKLCK